MGIEIERKFLLEGLTEDLEILSSTTISQGYLATGEEELRIRWMGDKFFLTLKRGTGLAREEHEFEISSRTFFVLGAGKKMLSKVRHKVNLSDGLFAEIDDYVGLTDPLMTVEVEFDSLEAAERFVPPSWFGKEVTGDKTYSNAKLASMVVGYA